MAVLDRSMLSRRALCEGPPVEAVVLPPEIGFLLAHGVPYRTLAQAAEMARQCRIDAATTLLNTGLVAEEAFYRALAASLGTVFLDDPRLCEAARHQQILDVGAAPLAPSSPCAVVSAPRGRAVARLIEAQDRLRALPAITTPTRLRLAVFAQCADAIAAEAADGLQEHFPEWSCRPGVRPIDLMLAGSVLALLFLVTSLSNGFSMSLLGLVQCATAAMLMVRFASIFVPSRPNGASDIPCLDDASLPTYTVLVALYRESRVVDQLVRSLGRLDYPAAKLDIKFLIEADDTETAEALRRVPMPARFEIVTAPPGLPRTKPRALNVALRLARGDYLVVYDAEDVVDPRQLKLAATLFARAPATTACLQGRLLIDNCKDGWLTRGIMAQTPQAA